MDREIWIKWEPVKNLEEIAYCITSFSDDEHGITLIIKQYRDKSVEAGTLCIIFGGPVIFYSKTADSLCILPTDSNDIDYGPDIGKWSFFKVLNSLIVTSLQKNLSTNLPQKALLHFVVTEVESDTHVITTQEPYVEWICNDTESIS